MTNRVTFPDIIRWALKVNAGYHGYVRDVIDESDYQGDHIKHEEPSHSPQHTR